MTTYPVLSLHPATRDSIEAQGVTATAPRTYRCGCHERGMGRLWLCPYHDGFDAGVTHDNYYAQPVHLESDET